MALMLHRPQRAPSAGAPSQHLGRGIHSHLLCHGVTESLRLERPLRSSNPTTCDCSKPHPSVPHLTFSTSTNSDSTTFFGQQQRPQGSPNPTIHPSPPCSLTVSPCLHGGKHPSCGVVFLLLFFFFLHGSYQCLSVLRASSITLCTSMYPRKSISQFPYLPSQFVSFPAAIQTSAQSFHMEALTVMLGCWCAAVMSRPS